MKFLKNLWKNTSTIITALILAIIVWVSSVLSADPNTLYSGIIQIEIIGLEENQALVGEFQNTVSVELIAPQSIWEQLNANAEFISATVDVSDLGTGDYFIPVEVIVELSPSRVITVNPSEVRIQIENVVSVEKTILAVPIGELATGYQADELSHEDLWANISGPQSLVSRVNQVVAVIDISGLRDTVTQEVPLKILDEDGIEIIGLDITPSKISVTQEISPKGGYKDVLVSLDLIGELEIGYKLTDITVSPLLVSVYSSDPTIVTNMPGNVYTEQIDLTGLSEDLEIRVLLQLPDGVSLESEEKTILVQIEVSPIESSDTIRVPIQVVGLISGLEVVLPYPDLELLISGPIPILNTLTADDILLVIDLTDLTIGTFLVEPQIESIPDGLVIDTIIPEIEVTIQPAIED